MTTGINNFLSAPIDGLIQYLLTDSDNDPVFDELTTLPSNKKSKNIPSKNLKRKTVDCLNQPIAKKNLIIMKTPSLENNLKTYPEKGKKELLEPINQTHERIKVYCLEKIQMDFANQFNVDIQEIKKIYLEVSTHSPTANQPSIINTKIPVLTNGLKLDPVVKRTLVDSINRLVRITNKSLEEVQMDFANQFNVDIQEIKKIHLDVSTHSPTANQPSVINTTLLIGNKLKMNPMFKRTLVDSINRLVRITNRSLEEIQMDFANQFKVDIQEIKKIYLEVSTHSPTANQPLIINTKIPLVTNGLKLDPALKKTLVDSINRLVRITNRSLEEIQMDFANQFKVDIQEIKKIYLEVSTHSPTANQPSVINTTLLVGNKLEMNVTFKKILVDSVNRLFHITNRSLEEIQLDFANQLNIDIQEIKKIYLDISTRSPTANQTSIIEVKASFIKNNTIISPELKKKIVYDINQTLGRLKNNLFIENTNTLC